MEEGRAGNSLLATDVVPRGEAREQASCSSYQLVREESAMKTKRVLMLAWLACVLSGTACAPTGAVPESFVAVEEAKLGPYDSRAVSAEGVVYAVRKIENPRGGTLDFWAAAAQRELTEGKGYSLEASEAIRSATGWDGRLLRFTAERSGAPFTYLVALYVRDVDIVVAEAGGRAGDVRKHEADILDAMGRAG